MARRILLTTLLAALVGSQAPAQVVIQGQGRTRAQFQPALDSQIVIGDGAISKGSRPAFTGGDQQAFQAAMAALEAQGAQSGTIEVLPGTYVFDQPVQIKLPGVRISGGPNARIVAGAGLGGACFQVLAGASDVVVEGLSLEDLRDPPPAGPTLFDVAGARFALLACRVRRANLAPPAARSVSVQLVGVAGALFEGNRFVVGQQGDGRGVPTLAEADGVCMLAAKNGHGLRLLGNSFESALAPTAMLTVLESAIALENERATLITGNSFSYLAARLAGSANASPMMQSITTVDPGPGTRLTYRGNYVERLTCASILRVVGTANAPAPVLISGNDFGRSSSIVGGGVYLEHADGSVISDNGFHNIGQDASTSPSLRVVDSDGVTLSGNVFSLPKHRQVWLSSCAGATIAGNSFRGQLTAGSPDAYLHLDDVSDASIVQNRFPSDHCPAISMTQSSGSASVFVCGNTFPRGCGVSGLPWVSSGYAVIQCDTAGSLGNPVF